MKYGVAVVSPRVAIRSVCVYHPPGRMGVVGLAFLEWKRSWRESLFESHTYLLAWD